MRLTRDQVSDLMERFAAAGLTAEVHFTLTRDQPCDGATTFPDQLEGLSVSSYGGRVIFGHLTKHQVQVLRDRFMACGSPLDPADEAAAVMLKKWLDEAVGTAE